VFPRKYCESLIATTALLSSCFFRPAVRCGTRRRSLLQMTTPSSSEAVPHSSCPRTQREFSSQSSSHQHAELSCLAELGTWSLLVTTRAVPLHLSLAPAHAHLHRSWLVPTCSGHHCLAFECVGSHFVLFQRHRRATHQRARIHPHSRLELGRLLACPDLGLASCGQHQPALPCIWPAAVAALDTLPRVPYRTHIHKQTNPIGWSRHEMRRPHRIHPPTSPTHPLAHPPHPPTHPPHPPHPPTTAARKLDQRRPRSWPRARLAWLTPCRRF
jgi:hypothetical protein